MQAARKRGAGAIVRRARMVGDFEMQFRTKTKVQARPGDVRVLSDEEYVAGARRLQRENDAAHLRATIARMARDAASPATGKSTRRSRA